MTRCIILLILAACTCTAYAGTGADSIRTARTDSSLSTVLRPARTAAYYIDRSVKYFMTMKSSVPLLVQPQYSEQAIRWEWHPWLLLTGYSRSSLISSDIMLKLYPTGYDTIDCRAFDRQPFCRCHVVFNYSGTRVPIYEEFTFDDRGQITFIEAWSDYPSLIPMHRKDYWAEGTNVKRLSTRVPGLGSPDARIDINSPAMLNAAAKDTTVSDLIRRLRNPLYTYMIEFLTHRHELEEAIHPPKGDVYPYYP